MEALKLLPFSASLKHLDNCSPFTGLSLADFGTLPPFLPRNERACLSRTAGVLKDSKQRQETTMTGRQANVRFGSAQLSPSSNPVALDWLSPKLELSACGH